MTLRVSHATTVVTPDSGDGKVSSNAWNADHAFSGTPYATVGFNSAGTAIEVLTLKTPGMFGAVGDGTTDDALALQAWLDSGGHLYLPEAEYYSSAKLLIRKHVQIEGAGYTESSAATGYDNQPGSRIRFAAGVGGFDIQPRTTETDVATAVAAGAGGLTQEGAACSSIKNLALVGANTGATVTGLYSRVTVNLENVWVVQFTGKGFDISASSDVPDGNSEYGNADRSLLVNCSAKQNGSHGLHLRGRDANVCNIINFNSMLNGGWGILDESFLGNTFTGPHTATNTLGDIKSTSLSTFLHPYVESGGSASIGNANTIVGYDLNDINTLPAGDSTPPATYTAATCNSLKFRVHENVVASAISTNLGYMFRSADYGTVLQGKGTAGDVGLMNRAGNVALHVSPNSLNVSANGSLLVTGNGDSYTFGDFIGRMLITSATGYSLMLNTNGSGTGTIQYHKDGTGNGALNISGSPLNLQVSNSTIAALTGSGIAVTGTLSATGTVSGSNLNTSGLPTSLAGLSIVGRSANTTGVTAAITGTDGQVLRVSGTTLGFGGVAATAMPALTGDVTTSAGAVATTIANDAVTYPKMQNVSATDKVLGRSTAGSGDVEEIACTSFGRSLIDDADAATARSTLGVAPLGQSAVASSVTGTLVETTLATITLPANAMGANGQIKLVVDITCTNSANNKVFKVKLGSTAVLNITSASVAGYVFDIGIGNRNSAASQRFHTRRVSSTGTSSYSVGTSTEDTTGALTITVTGTLTNTGETITVESYIAQIFPAA